MVLSKTRPNMVNYHKFAPVPLVHHFSPLKRPFGGIPAYPYVQTQPDVSWTLQTRNSWHDAGAVWLKLPQLAITAPAVLVVGRMSCFDGCFGWLSGRHVAFMYKWLPYQFHIFHVWPHQQCETREIRPRPATKMSFCSHQKWLELEILVSGAKKSQAKLADEPQLILPTSKEACRLKVFFFCIVLGVHPIC